MAFNKELPTAGEGVLAVPVVEEEEGALLLEVEVDGEEECVLRKVPIAFSTPLYCGVISIITSERSRE